MQRPDGTYDLPASSVAIFWSSEQGEVVRFSLVDSEWHAITHGKPIDPQPGRWLPWTPPVFPQRKKCAVRLCIVEYEGRQQLAAWFLEEQPIPFRIADPCLWLKGDARVIKWLTPEFEDELTTEGT